MPSPEFIAATALAAVAVILIILRIRSGRQLRRSARDLQCSQQRLEGSQRRLANSLDELSVVVKMAEARIAERRPESERIPSGSSGEQSGPAALPRRTSLYAWLVRIYARRGLGPVKYAYARRRKRSGRRLAAR